MLQEARRDDQHIIATPDIVTSDRALYFACKRAMDLTLAALLLLCASPVLVIIAIAIKLDSRGPVMFIQERVGARRRRKVGRVVWERQNFYLYKYRSMSQHADQSMHEAHIKAFVEGRIATTDGARAGVKLANDYRVTRVGRFLRRSSLDELPQLLNVLKGEMSLVGPRPVPTYEVAAYTTPSQRQRLAALPGMTGLWQVKGRGRVSFEELIEMDLTYIRNQSLWLDIKLLLLTFPAILIGHGAQ
jgi:lipopolysaccharide/colanic/teichoic acid biosynthesis glycosyltransferase